MWTSFPTVATSGNSTQSTLLHQQQYDSSDDVACTDSVAPPTTATATTPDKRETIAEQSTTSTTSTKSSSTNYNPRYHPGVVVLQQEQELPLLHSSVEQLLDADLAAAIVDSSSSSSESPIVGIGILPSPHNNNNNNNTTTTSIGEYQPQALFFPERATLSLALPPPPPPPPLPTGAKNHHTNNRRTNQKHLYLHKDSPTSQPPTPVVGLPDETMPLTATATGTTGGVSKLSHPAMVLDSKHWNKDPYNHHQWNPTTTTTTNTDDTNKDTATTNTANTEHQANTPKASIRRNISSPDSTNKTPPPPPTFPLQLPSNRGHVKVTKLQPKNRNTTTDDDDQPDQGMVLQDPTPAGVPQESLTRAMNHIHNLLHHPPPPPANTPPNIHGSITQPSPQPTMLPDEEDEPAAIPSPQRNNNKEDTTTTTTREEETDNKKKDTTKEEVGTTETTADPNTTGTSSNHRSVFAGRRHQPTTQPTSPEKYLPTGHDEPAAIPSPNKETATTMSDEETDMPTNKDVGATTANNATTTTNNALHHSRVTQKVANATTSITAASSTTVTTNVASYESHEEHYHDDPDDVPEDESEFDAAKSRGSDKEQQEEEKKEDDDSTSRILQATPSSPEDDTTNFSSAYTSLHAMHGSAPSNDAGSILTQTTNVSRGPWRAPTVYPTQPTHHPTAPSGGAMTPSTSKTPVATNTSSSSSHGFSSPNRPVGGGGVSLAHSALSSRTAGDEIAPMMRMRHVAAQQLVEIAESGDSESVRRKDSPTISSTASSRHKTEEQVKADKQKKWKRKMKQAQQQQQKEQEALDSHNGQQDDDDSVEYDDNESNVSATFVGCRPTDGIAHFWNNLQRGGLAAALQGDQRSGRKGSKTAPTADPAALFRQMIGRQCGIPSGESSSDDEDESYHHGMSYSDVQSDYDDEDEDEDESVDDSFSAVSSQQGSQQIRGRSRRPRSRAPGRDRSLSSRNSDSVASETSRATEEGDAAAAKAAAEDARLMREAQELMSLQKPNFRILGKQVKKSKAATQVQEEESIKKKSALKSFQEAAGSPRMERGTVTNKKGSLSVVSAMSKQSRGSAAATAETIPMATTSATAASSPSAGTNSPSTVFSGTSSAAAMTAFTTVATRDIHDKNFIKSFIADLGSRGVTLLWHSNTPSPPQTVRAYLKLQSTDVTSSNTFNSPRLVWYHPTKSQNRSSFTSISGDDASVYTADIATGADMMGEEAGSVDLFDIASISTAGTSTSDLKILKQFPFSMPGRCIAVKLNSSRSADTPVSSTLLMEAKTEEVAKAFVYGIKWMVARLAFNLIIGNVDISCELYDACVASEADDDLMPRPPRRSNVLKTNVLNAMACHMVDKSSEQTHMYQQQQQKEESGQKH